MANVVSGRFFRIEATSGGSTNEHFNILGLYWTSDEAASADIAADDDFACTDTAGNIIIEKRAEAAGDGLEITFGFPGIPVVGFVVTKLDGGICHVIADRVVQA